MLANFLLSFRVSDAEEELTVARARGELSRLMRQNDNLEQGVLTKSGSGYRYFLIAAAGLFLDKLETLIFSLAGAMQVLLG